MEEKIKIDEIEKTVNQEENFSNEVEQQEPEVLSEDELYAKIQTEKLLKKKKTKRIVTLSSLCVAFVLAIVVIILACVPISLKPNCLQDGFVSVAMFPGTTNGSSLNENDEKFGQFMKYYNKAFSQTCLTALFSGSAFSYKIEESSKEVSNVLGEMGELVGNGTYFVRLRYAEERTFTQQNGKPYLSQYRNSSWNGIMMFSEAFFVVNQTAGVQDTKIYVVVDRPVNDEKTIQTFITVTVKADTNVIYDAWKDLTEKKA